MGDGIDTFAFLRLRGATGNWRALHEAFTAALPPERVWGAFFGLFGVASNELLAITVGSEAEVGASIDVARRLEGAMCEEVVSLAPTVRPISAVPLKREGFHVLRFFDVVPAHHDEFAALSKAAWETFETTDAYQAEPQGLFRGRDEAAGRDLMLLVTWYDGLGSWQTSRQPPEAARQRFERRGQLATRTIAYATRLIV